jgi:predicted dienelactone hydrolase
LMKVGCRALAVPDAVQAVTLPVWVLYPTNESEVARSFGPYTMAVAMNAPVAGRDLPLVVISHGNNGSPLTHRDTAIALARAGFVVVLPEHLGNSRTDSTLAGTAAMLAHRPRHVTLSIDAVLADAAFRDHVRPTEVRVIGHSIGAYTALAVAGALPNAMTPDQPAFAVVPVPVTPDARVRALVLLAPACGWFMVPGALANVRVPILMYSGHQDHVTPLFHAELVLSGVAHPEQVKHIVVHGAGHHAFQTPFPPSMTRPDFPPSQDPQGFDRAAFHGQMNDEIVAYLLARD